MAAYKGLLESASQRAKLPSGIELEYATLGDPSNPALVLISGLGAMLIQWSEPLLERLVDAGFYVIAFDNRDVGLSTMLTDLPAPSELPAGLKERFNTWLPLIHALVSAVGVGVIERRRTTLPSRYAC